MSIPPIVPILGLLLIGSTLIQYVFWDAKRTRVTRQMAEALYHSMSWEAKTRLVEIVSYRRLREELEDMMFMAAKHKRFKLEPALQKRIIEQMCEFIISIDMAELVEPEPELVEAYIEPTPEEIYRAQVFYPPRREPHVYPEYSPLKLQPKKVTSGPIYSGKREAPTSTGIVRVSRPPIDF